jgi:hypothetical protein
LCVDGDEAFDDAQIFIFTSNAIMNNDSNSTVNQLTRNEKGLWIYTMPNAAISSMNANDFIEYFVYANKANYGFFTSHYVLNIQGTKL